MPRRHRNATTPTLTTLDERTVPAVLEGVDTTGEVTITTTQNNQTTTLTPFATTILEDGKVLVAGTVPGSFTGVEGAKESLLGVVRLTATGAVDTTFNNGQIQTIAAGTNQAASVQQILTDSAGTVTLFGSTYDVPNIPGPQATKIVLARLTSDGAVDTSFGTNGVSVLTLDPTTNTIDQQIGAAEIMSDGRVVILGTRPAITGTSGLIGSEFILARLTATGQFDTTFGDGGRTIVNVDRGGYTSQVTPGDVVVADDGSITFAGTWLANGAISTEVGDNNTFVLARLTAAGNVDSTFDGDGRQYLRGPVVANADGSGVDLEQLDNSRIILAGTLGTNSSIGDGVIIQLNADGSPDKSLDGDGVLVLSPTNGTVARPFSVATGPDGSITVGVAQSNLGNGDNATTVVRRFTATGEVDSSFQTTTQTITGNALTTDLDVSKSGTVLLTSSTGVKSVSADGKTVTTFYTQPTSPPPVTSNPSPISPTPTSPATATSLPSGLGTASADFNGDGFADVVQVVNTNQLRLINGKTGSVLVDNMQPYESRYKGGIQVAAGDFNRDGRSEVVVSPNDGGSGRVIVLRTTSTTSKTGTTWSLDTIASFFGINDANFRGGASIAAADFNGDGFADLAVGAGNTGGPRVAMYDGKTLAEAPTRLTGDFFALPDESFRGGVNLAAIDTNSDGFAELAVGAGVGGAPRVRVFDTRRLLANTDDAVVSDSIVGNASARAGVMLSQRAATAKTKTGFAAYVGQTRFSPQLSRQIFTGFDTQSIGIDVTVPPFAIQPVTETEPETTV